MPRGFSTAARAAKALKWKLNGTTQPIDWAQKIIEAAVDQIPELAGKIDSAMIDGDPHPTGDDPFHASGVLGKKSMKGKNRFTSFHAYPDGTVKFSDKKLPVVKVEKPAETSSSNTYQPEKSAEPEWVWDEAAQKYRYWDGSKWVWQ